MGVVIFRSYNIVRNTEEQLLEYGRRTLVILDQVAPVLFGGDCAVAHGRFRLLRNGT